MLFPRKIFYYVSFLGLYLLAISSPGLSQEDTWTKKADMPTARLGHATCVVAGKIYATGGYPIADAPGLITVEVYDPATDKWTTKTPMPMVRCQLAVSVVNEKIYAIGGASGFDVLSTIEVYDPINDIWKSKISSFKPRVASFVVLNEKIYALGGALTVKPPHPAVSTVELYTPFK